MSSGRVRKVADRIQVIVAEMLERRIKDPRLGFVTITDVRVTGDLQHASLFYTVFGDAGQRAQTARLLELNKGKLRSFVGKQLGIRLTPSLEFVADANAAIVRGEIVLLEKIFSGQKASDILAFDIEGFFRRIGLDQFLTSQRRTGMASMVSRIRQLAQEVAGAPSGT